MGQTLEGVIKFKQTMLLKYGLTDDGRSKFFVEIGREGGKSRHPNKGFGGDRERARREGARGGKMSSRGPNKEKQL